MEDHQDYEIAFDVRGTDEDVFISKSESKCAPHVAFNLINVDRYGKLTRAVLMAGFAMFDTDRDGLITQEDFDGQAFAILLSLKKSWTPTSAGKQHCFRYSLL